MPSLFLCKAVMTAVQFAPLIYFNNSIRSAVCSPWIKKQGTLYSCKLDMGMAEKYYLGIPGLPLPQKRLEALLNTVHIAMNNHYFFSRKGKFRKAFQINGPHKVDIPRNLYDGNTCRNINVHKVRGTIAAMNQKIEITSFINNPLQPYMIAMAVRNN